MAYKNLISIIIPVYNVEQYLRRCISSILTQTVQDFEVLLIDDGSTDASGAICDEFAAKDKRIHCIHTVNAGVSTARNKGLEIAVGEYVAFVDSDDYIEPDYLEQILQGGKKADVIFFGCDVFYPTGRSIRYLPVSSYTDTKREIEKTLHYLKYNDQQFEFLGYTWSKVFKREIIDKYQLRFISGLNYREDEIFTLEYVQYVASIRVLTQSLYHYRVLETGLTKRNKTISDYTVYAQYICQFSKDFEYWPLKNELLEQALLHLYMAGTKMSAIDRNENFKDIWRYISGVDFKYRPLRKRAKLLFSSKGISKYIVKILSIIEKNKY